MAAQPNALAVAWSILRSLLRVRPPSPGGGEPVDHQGLSGPLQHLAEGPPGVIAELDDDLRSYLDHLSSVDPDRLSADGALAYWVNLYNAGALLLAAEAWRDGQETVLRIPGGFQRKLVEVAGERLSLDDVEHAKVRRFHDPRVHAALVCGAVSCPTLRHEPYTEEMLEKQLDDQMRHFLASGALSANTDRGLVSLSRVFLWFGGDFVRPHRMPTLLPASKQAVLASLTQWMDSDQAAWIESARPKVEFQPYDWGLRCTVG